MRAPLSFCTPSAVILTAASAAGHLAVAAAEGAVVGVSMGHAAGPAAAARLARMRGETLESADAFGQCDADRRLAAEVLDSLVRMVAGEPVSLVDVPVNLAHLSPFQRRVVAACRAIPFGSTRSYGELAQAAGSPGAARAVGQVMAANRLPLIVPCHRVLGAGGRLGGFSAPSGVALKRQLLAIEAAGAAAPRLVPRHDKRHRVSA
jgi:methylated-DNA-[protein]-cysteine S-methyltransferase